MFCPLELKVGRCWPMAVSFSKSIPLEYLELATCNKILSLVAICFSPATAPIVIADPADGLQFVTRFQEGAQNPIPVTEVHHTSVGNNPSDPICRINVTLQWEYSLYSENTGSPANKIKWSSNLLLRCPETFFISHENAIFFQPLV